MIIVSSPVNALAEVLSSPGITAAGGGGGSKSPVIMLFVGLFFLAVGGLQAANPRLLWRMNKWQYKNPDANEPSDKGFLVQRVLGGLFAVVGLVVVVIALTRL